MGQALTVLVSDSFGQVFGSSSATVSYDSLTLTSLSFADNAVAGPGTTATSLVSKGSRLQERLIIGGTGFASASIVSLVVRLGALQEGQAGDPCLVCQFPFAESEICTVVVDSVTSASLQCDVAPGVGKNLAFQVEATLVGGQRVWSAVLPSLVFSYAPPVLIANSLRFITDPPSNGAPSITSSRTEGDLIGMDALHVGGNKELLEVFYGPATEPTRYSCAVQSVDDAGYNFNGQAVDTITCLQAIGAGQGLVFTLLSGFVTLSSQFLVQPYAQPSAPGSDSFSYPIAPIVEAVSGCPSFRVVNGITSAFDCPTSGMQASRIPLRITITGQHFGSSPNVQVCLACQLPQHTLTPFCLFLNCHFLVNCFVLLQILVAGRQCLQVLHDVMQAPGTRLTCVLPPGSGESLSIEVRTPSSDRVCRGSSFHAWPFIILGLLLANRFCEVARLVP